MRKTHKKTCRNKRKTCRNKRKTCRNKRKTCRNKRKTRQGGVGTRGQAAALQQVFNTVNRPDARDEIAEILAHQSYGSMEESLRRDARVKAKDMARTATREHAHEHRTRKEAIKLTRPSRATLTALREKGTQRARDNQHAYGKRDEIRRIIEADRLAAINRLGLSPQEYYTIMPVPLHRADAAREAFIQRKFPTPFDRFEM